MTRRLSVSGGKKEDAPRAEEALAQLQKRADSGEAVAQFKIGA